MRYLEALDYNRMSKHRQYGHPVTWMRTTRATERVRQQAIDRLSDYSRN